jgi:hypothetical protein
MDINQQTTENSPIAGYCRACGKPLTPESRRYAGGTIYCDEHAPAAAAASPPPVPAASISASPGLAFALGLIPGVGAIYNGQYAKGLVHAIIFGLLITIMSSDIDPLQPIIGIMIAAFLFYMAFEASHTARRRMLGQPVDEFSSLVNVRQQSYTGGLLLIVLGVVFLLNTLDILSLRQVLKFWPVLLIALGATMLYQRIRTDAGDRPGPDSSPSMTSEVHNER